jgi:hypothetical protein
MKYPNTSINNPLLIVVSPISTLHGTDGFTKEYANCFFFHYQFGDVVRVFVVKIPLRTIKILISKVDLSQRKNKIKVHHNIIN